MSATVATDRTWPTSEELGATYEAFAKGVEALESLTRRLSLMIDLRADTLTRDGVERPTFEEVGALARWMPILTVEHREASDELKSLRKLFTRAAEAGVPS